MTDSARWLGWRLACRLFAIGAPVRESSLTPLERKGLARLRRDHAVELAKRDLRFVLCPYCQQERGPVFRIEEQIVCDCLECGPVAVADEDRQAWQLKPDWMLRKVRAALNLDGAGQAELSHGAVRLGLYERHPVVVAPSLDALLRHPDVIRRAGIGRNATPWVMTAKPLRDVDTTVFGGDAQWWSLEERFVLFGGALSFVPPGAELADLGSEPAGPTHGPFSADFRWVFLDDAPYDPVLLPDAQAAIFKALWHFRGVPQTAEVIMNRAGLNSPRPSENFKVKDKNKGDPRYERPKLAYDTLVERRQHEGLYWMPCAAPPPLKPEAAPTAA